MTKNDVIQKEQLRDDSDVAAIEDVRQRDGRRMFQWGQMKRDGEGAMYQSNLSFSPVIAMNSPIKWDQANNEVFLDDPELEQLLLRLHGCADLPEFWTATRAILDALVPSDASLMYVNFHNFAKNWEASRVFVTPKADKPAGWMQKRRMVDLMPPFILDRPNLPMFKLSDVCTDPRELQNTEFFRKYMGPDGWQHSACLLFWEGSALHSEITIRRKDSQGDFTPAEVTLLGRLRPHFSTVLNRLVKNRRKTATDPVVLKMAPSNLIRNIDQRAYKSVAANDSIRCLVSEEPRASSEATLLERGEEGSQHATIAFSDKERAVLRLAVRGGSNDEISRCLGVTIHTVKFHLAKVYLKLGVKNRTAAVKAALSMELV